MHRPDKEMKRKIKLQEYLKQHGYARSNREVNKLIRDHTVLVNGVRVQSCCLKVDPISASVHVVIDDSNPLVVEPKVAANKTNALGDEDHGVSSDIHAVATTDLPLQKPNHHLPQHHHPEVNNTPGQTSTQYYPLCILYHKPCGVLCTTTPSKDGIPTLADSMIAHDSLSSSSSIPPQYHHVGRLDWHSRGLLLFSLDGRLTSALLSPVTALERVYRIVVESDTSLASSDTQTALRKSVSEGVHTDYGFFQGTIRQIQCPVGKDYPHAQCVGGIHAGGQRLDRKQAPIRDIEFANDEQHDLARARAAPTRTLLPTILSSITVAVQEGKNRMVRRMFAALGFHVVDLQRLEYGAIHLDDSLHPGQWRFGTPAEDAFCRSIVQEWEAHGARWDTSHTNTSKNLK